MFRKLNYPYTQPGTLRLKQVTQLKNTCTPDPTCVYTFCTARGLKSLSLVPGLCLTVMGKLETRLTTQLVGQLVNQPVSRLGYENDLAFFDLTRPDTATWPCQVKIARSLRWS